MDEFSKMEQLHAILDKTEELINKGGVSPDLAKDNLLSIRKKTEADTSLSPINRLELDRRINGIITTLDSKE